ncbi:hypothetical protein ACJJTC_016826 [Scirpophaga incertulas]
MIKRDKNGIIIRNFKDEEILYKVLYIFPFNSDTKRMGIIIKKDDQYVFYEKGADTVMKNIIKVNDWVEEETDNMARDGLRTLVVAKRVLPELEFQKFARAYNKARKSLVDRNELMLAVQSSLENDLDIVGITVVEDKLQDKVKQTLECIRNAGIKIWMLTGDKIETAISIAFSSRLLTKHDHYTIIVKCKSKEEIDKDLTRLSLGGFNALVIDGCRYSPTQKALMASRLRIKAKETVLCIGDGRNDVSMITSADIGVGIEGSSISQSTRLDELHFSSVSLSLKSPGTDED